MRSCLICQLSCYLAYRTVQCRNNSSKRPSIQVVNIFELVDQFRRRLDRLNVVSTVYCLVGKVQKQWFGLVVSVDDIDSFVREQVCAVVAPFREDRLQDLTVTRFS